LKEAKWISLEAAIRPYYEKDEVLRNKFQETKFSLVYKKRISNYVYLTEKMRKECRKLNKEIDRLRKILT
jgi:hypothetical protein